MKQPLIPHRAAAAIALAALILCATLAGCTGAPNRQPQADNLVKTLRSMPGVADAYVSYENAIGRGATLYVYVSIPAATQQQIVNIVDAINRTRGHDFDAFEQQYAFRPTGTPTVNLKRGSTLDADAIAAHAIALRQIASTVSADDIDWWDADPGRLDMTELETAGPQTLAAIRTAVGEQPLQAQLRPHHPSTETPLWLVTFPLGADQQARIEAQLAAMTARPRIITVTNANITGLTVEVSPMTADAYTQLLNVITVTSAGPQQPLALSWNTPGEPPNPNTSGLVTIGQCNYPPTTTGAQPSPSGLQQLLRQKYDTCPR